MSTQSSAQALVDRLIEGGNPASGLTPDQRKTLARVDAVLMKGEAIPDFDTEQDVSDAFAEEASINGEGPPKGTEQCARMARFGTDSEDLAMLLALSYDYDYVDSVLQSMDL